MVIIGNSWRVWGSVLLLLLLCRAEQSSISLLSMGDVASLFFMSVDDYFIEYVTPATVILLSSRLCPSLENRDTHTHTHTHTHSQLYAQTNCPLTQQFSNAEIFMHTKHTHTHTHTHTFMCAADFDVMTSGSHLFIINNWIIIQYVCRNRRSSSDHADCASSLLQHMFLREKGKNLLAE